MLGNFFGRSTYRKQRVNKKQIVEIYSPSASGAKGSARNMLVSFRLCLRHHCQFLTLAFFVKNIFEKDLIKNMRDGHEYQIISFRKMSTLKRSFQ
jgi:hypothetical protein